MSARPSCGSRRKPKDDLVMIGRLRHPQLLETSRKEKDVFNPVQGSPSSSAYG